MSKKSAEATPKKKSKKKLWLGLGIGVAGVSVVTVVISCIITIVILLGILIGGAFYIWKISDSTSTHPGFTTNNNSDTVTIPGSNGSITVIIPGNTATVPTDAPAEELEVGNAIGNLCPSDELNIITSDGITNETFDPTNTGKITIIHFWGTWCGPCVIYLPDFNLIATEFAGQVEVFAVHTSMVLDTAPMYIANHYADSNITFLADYDNGGKDDAFFTALGGNGAYPYTVILDENGVIMYKNDYPMDYDELLEQIMALC